jgi:molecular chaperone DnaJ
MNREWVEKDFYKVLGVLDTASAEEVKKAYRKLAQTHHPDANPGDASAEERFKEISEAYATLSDPEQRKEYDQVRRLAATGGFQGFGGQTGGFGGFGGQQVRVEDLEDLLGGVGGLGDLFGFGSQQRSRRGPTQGADLTTELTIGFEDAAFGVTTEVTIEGADTCSRCHGSGAEPGTSVTTCPTCGGRGVVAQNQGFFSFSQACPECGGSGRLIEKLCAQCRGSGVENRRRTVKLKVPAGVKDGATLRLRDKGAPGSFGGPPGDLLVRIRVASSAKFGRKDNDLTLKVPITYTEAALGAKIDVPTLNGEVKVKIPPGTPSGKIFRVRGKGIEPERGRQGDLLVTVEVAVPQKVNKDEKRLLEELAEHETEDIRSHLR